MQYKTIGIIWFKKKDNLCQLYVRRKFGIWIWFTIHGLATNMMQIENFPKRYLKFMELHPEMNSIPIFFKSQLYYI